MMPNSHTHTERENKIHHQTESSTLNWMKYKLVFGMNFHCVVTVIWICLFEMRFGVYFKNTLSHTREFIYLYLIFVWPSRISKTTHDVVVNTTPIFHAECARKRCLFLLFFAVFREYRTENNTI